LIHYNGDVCCCCEDTYGDLLRANVFDRTIGELSYSERHAQIVDDLRGAAKERTGQADARSVCEAADGQTEYSHRRTLDSRATEDSGGRRTGKYFEALRAAAVGLCGSRARTVSTRSPA